MRGQRAAALIVVGYCLVSLAGGVLIRLDGPAVDHSGGWGAMAAVLLALPVAVLLLWHLPRHPVTVILAVYVTCSATTSGPLAFLDVAAADGWRREVVERAQSVVWVGTLPLLPLLITVVPDGIPRGSWRRVFQVQAAAVATLAAMTLLDGPEQGLALPIAAAGVASGVTLVITSLLGAGRLVVRTVGDPDVRREVRPVAVVATATAAVYVVGGIIPDLLPEQAHPALRSLGYPFVVGGLPAAIGYAVMRHQLLGISIVIARVLLAGLTSLLLASAYLGAVLALALALDVPRGSLPAVLVPAAVVAFVLVPAHRALQRLLTQAVYGSRGDPLGVLRTLGEQLATTAPEEVPQRIADVVRETLALPWVALEVQQEDARTLAAQAGTPIPGTEVVPVDLPYAGSVPGRLVVQPRRGETSLSGVDRRLLRLVAQQAAPAVAATQYVHELTASRERLVLGREEERARLRRDLHDGLSPALSGISLALTAARQLVRSDPAAAEALLTSVGEEAGRSSGDVRRMLDDLRPPGLDELGLVAALEARARALTTPGGIAFTVQAEPLPPVPPAVETAAYRIAAEAMTNAARHAHADRCVVRVLADQELRVHVQDDGVGLPTPALPGLGMASMASRADEVGGRLRVGRCEAGGTEVVAELPLGVRT